MRLTITGGTGGTLILIVYVCMCCYENFIWS